VLKVADVFAHGVVITAMHTYARRDKDFAVDFDGIPDSTDFSFHPEPGSRPVMAGTLPARVTSTTENDTYGHIDKDGRYRVNMLFDRDSWETGFESLWVRQSRPYAEETYGLHLPLLAGTEVAIGFENGNPDRPYISGVLHDSAHGDHVTIRNYKRNVLRTPANNKIRLDDERGKEHIKVSTEYGGKSQLEQARSLAESLRSAAEAARAELADVQMQKALLSDALTDLKKAALLVSAPEGIAQVTGKSLQQSAGDNIISTSGGHTDFSALKRFTVAAGERVSLYAQKLGIKMFAGKGKVEIQAQGDEMTLDALKDIRISSSEGKVIISAKKEIVLTSGGGYIRIADGTVECAAPDKIIERGAVWQKFGGQSISQAMQSWENAEFAITPEVRRLSDDSPVAGLTLGLTGGDGTQQSLETSASGTTAVQNNVNVDSLDASLLDKT
jgi:type VI secretion system secreted protein VgrG